jgi:hypothetical protein
VDVSDHQEAFLVGYLNPDSGVLHRNKFGTCPGPKWEKVYVLREPADRPCCGAKIYFCPQANTIECPLHGGFQDCCATPDDHLLLGDIKDYIRYLDPAMREPIGEPRRRRTVKPGERVDVTPQVIRYLQERSAMGQERYGEPLRTGNGRDPFIDGFEELIDWMQYWAQALIEHYGGMPPGGGIYDD